MRPCTASTTGTVSSKSNPVEYSKASAVHTGCPVVALSATSLGCGISAYLRQVGRAVPSQSSSRHRGKKMPRVRRRSALPDATMHSRSQNDTINNPGSTCTRAHTVRSDMHNDTKRTAKTHQRFPRSLRRSTNNKCRVSACCTATARRCRRQ